MRTLVIGDIHGANKALLQCLERANFDPAEDKVIQLGDIVDGKPEVFESVETLLQIPNLISIKGNHDDWFLDYINTAYHPGGWSHGGKATILSYGKRLGRELKIIPCRDGSSKTSLNPGDIPESHRIFFAKQVLYHIDAANNCYVHGGFDRQQIFQEQRFQNFYWDRSLWTDALQYHTVNRRVPEKYPFHIRTKFHEIFIGHTPTTNWQTDRPLRAVNILNMDTGAGHNGRLSILDIHTKEYWQSDLVQELYPGL